MRRTVRTRRRGPATQVCVCTTFSHLTDDHSVAVDAPSHSGSCNLDRSCLTRSPVSPLQFTAWYLLDNLPIALTSTRVATEMLLGRADTIGIGSPPHPLAISTLTYDKGHHLREGMGHATVLKWVVKMSGDCHL